MAWRCLLYPWWGGPAGQFRSLPEPRARSLEARRYLTKARAAYRKADPEADGEDALGNLDTALSYAHSALNALLLHSRAPAHDPRDFESFYDVVGVPFQDLH